MQEPGGVKDSVRLSTRGWDTGRCCGLCGWCVCARAHVLYAEKHVCLGKSGRDKWHREDVKKIFTTQGYIQHQDMDNGEEEESWREGLPSLLSPSSPSELVA